MQYKILLLASFVGKENTREFLNDLNVNFNINSDKVFVFELNDDTHLITYKLKIDIGVRFDIKKEIPKTIQIHKKSLTFFTINALNKLIERDSELSVGNINHKEHQIDWGVYKNKLILLKNDRLEISDINRVFLSDL
jgi:hypothetical protein